MFVVVGGFGVIVWDDYFGERKFVEDGVDGVFVVEGDVVEYDVFFVVEVDVEFLVLLFNFFVGKFEWNIFGLGDVDGF